MPKRTQLFTVLPWPAGLNTTQDKTLIPPDKVIVADNIIIGGERSGLKRDGINYNFDDASSASDSIIQIQDYYYGTTKTHRLVAADDTGKWFQYQEDGTRATITPTASAEVTDVVCDTQANLNDEGFFYLNSANNSTNYYVWMDKAGDSTIGSPPSGYTAIRLDISGDTTADDVGTTMAAAIDALGDFGASNSSGTVTITNAANGPAVDAAEDADAPSGVTSITVTTQGTSAWTTPSEVTSTVFNDLCLMAANGTTNTLKYWDGTLSKAIDLFSSPSYLATEPAPPVCSLVQTHLGRIWTNDESNKDRIHFCETYNQYKWNGYGDSGALDIGIGDGDPAGITAIFPSFQGSLFVAKKTKLYRISGTTPESFQVTLVSDTLGCESHNSAVLIEDKDITWISTRGIHSLARTINFGDFEAQFLSKDIQKTFNDDFLASRLKNTHSVYLPWINSVGFAVTLSGDSSNKYIYWHNFQRDAWYRWEDVQCEAFSRVVDADQVRAYLGSATTRIGKTFAASNGDTSEAAASTSIPMVIETGFIAPDGNQYTEKGFKKFSLYYKPTNNQTVTVEFKVDSFPVQSLGYTISETVDLLGTTFTLGTSVLGTAFRAAAYTRSIDDFGTGFTVRITQDDADEAAEILGFMVEYEPAGDQQEVENST